MAISAARTLGDFSGFLTRDQAGAIFAEVAQRSVVQQLAREVPLGANGVSVPVVTGTLTAGWVAEGAQKPASEATMTLKTMDPKKLAVIAVVSSEVVRANPGGYMQQIQSQVAEAFAIAFDKAALYDQGPDGTAGAGPFATNIGSTANTVELGAGLDLHEDFVNGLSAVLADGYTINGFALDDRVEPLLLNARDGNDRPLYVDLINGNTITSPANVGIARQGRLLGRQAYMGPGVYSGTAADVEAVGGDWRQAAWGQVGGISYSVSNQATVTIGGTLTSLWENNLVAVRAETEFGFLVNDTSAFVTYTNAS
jgi:HK97 family phage major capsid protein